MYPQSARSTLATYACTTLPASVRGAYFATISANDDGDGAYHFATWGRPSHR